MRTVAESYNAGGVDSRSNPLNLPLPRGLRCRNWIPTDAGMWKARWGYTALTMTSAVETPIHSIADYQLWNGTQYALLGQGNHIYRRATSGAVERITPVAGLSSSNSWNYFRAGNKIYLGNGVDAKWYDGDKLRTNGIPAPDEAASLKTTIMEGVRESIGTESSSVSITQGATGSFSVTSGSGLQAYMAYFDPTWQELGPASAIASRQKVTVADRKFDVSGLPNLSTVDANWLKLLSVTEDDNENAYFCAVEAARQAESCDLVVYPSNKFGGRILVTLTGHGYSTGDVVMISGLDGDAEFNGVKSIEAIDADNFAYMCHAGIAAPINNPLVQKLLVVANAATTASIVQGYRDATMLANAERGLPIPVVQSDTPGYGFAVCFWNKTGGGHIGNRTWLTKRIKNTYRVNVRFKSFAPVADAEWCVLVGRTMDGAKLPYAMADAALNWFAVPGTLVQGDTVAACNFSNVDFDTELPTRNGIIPASDKFARVGSRYYCNPANSPYIYFSASEDNEKFPLVGDAAQCWAPNDQLTFPTGESISGIHELDLNLWCFSRHALAINTEVSGVQGWAGTWYGMGLAGQRAFVKTPYGPFWLTGARQLATRGEQGPISASDEYEAALLSKIGSAYLSKVELVYALDPAKRIDQVIIKAQDKDGKPFEVVHDFKLRDDRAGLGQGYERVYNGPLASNYTLAQVEDSDFVKRAWAGGADGVIYQTIDGYSDAGEEFDCDWIGLLNAGTNRPFIEEFSFFGDQALKISYLKNLNNHGEDDFSPLLMKARVPLATDTDLIGGDQNHEYFGNVKAGEMKFCYVRLQLTTHSADAPSSPLNDPPHLPLETYGTVYVTRATFQGQRGTE